MEAAKDDNLEDSVYFYEDQTGKMKKNKATPRGKRKVGSIDIRPEMRKVTRNTSYFSADDDNKMDFQLQSMKIDTSDIASSTAKKFNPCSPKKVLPIIGSKLFEITHNSLLLLNVEINYERLIDKGGYSKVYEGKIVDNDKRCAIKVIPSRCVYNEIGHMNEESIIKEIEFLEKLKNFKGCVRFLGYYNCEEESLFYLVFDYYDTDLNKFLVSRNHSKLPIDISVKIKIIQQMVMILSFLQKNGILHRDIKTKNFLLNEEKNDSDIRIRICDFGIAIYTEDLMKNPKLKGTKCYMAPELRKYFNDDHEQEPSELEIKRSSQLFEANITDSEILDTLGTDHTIQFTDELSVTVSPSFKSDVFSFGLCVLSILGYNIKNCNIEENSINKILNDLIKKEKIPKELVSTLRTCLDWEKDKRYDFIYLEYIFLNRYKCPLEFKYPSPVNPYKYLQISYKTFEGIDHNSNFNQFLAYFAESGWKNVDHSPSLIKNIRMSIEKKQEFPEELVSHLVNDLHHPSPYLDFLINNADRPFIALCKCYSYEGELYKMINNDIAFSYRQPERTLTSLFMQYFLRAYPRINIYKPKVLMVYRGISCSIDNSDLAFKLISEHVPGIEYYWHSFVSTTKNKKVAMEFLKRKEFSDRILFIIYLSPNSDKRKFDIEEFSEMKGEEEVLLVSHFKFRVLSNEIKRLDSMTYNEITIEEIVPSKMPFKILWADTTIKFEKNQEKAKIMRKLGYELIEVESEEAAESYIKNNPTSIIFALSSGSLGRILFPRLTFFSNVKYLGIYCLKEENHKSWATTENFSNLLIFTSDFTIIESFLSEVANYLF